MTVNKEGIQLLHHFESCSLKSYKCPANVWTIGWGNTFYEDGSKVIEGDLITQERADELFKNILDKFSKKAKSLIKKDLTDNQFSALVSFSYNVGTGNLASSTLLKKVNVDPLDNTIESEFLKWNKANKKVLNGLTRRRQAEADLYLKKPTL